MKILAVDIGTGTQDIYLYDSALDLENGFKLVLPSPTMIVYRRLLQATQRRQAVALTGVIMGGGPSAWAAERHIQAGLPLYATPDAARSFNDDLDRVRQMGVQVVSEDGAARLPDDVLRLALRDFDFDAIAAAFGAFGVALDDLDAVAAAVFDHGDAPPHVSDRQFRFDYLDERLRAANPPPGDAPWTAANPLSAFAFLAEQLPPSMTRLRAVAASARSNPRLQAIPLVVMDTAPAAVLGATFDPHVRAMPRKLIANVGNFHTLAFRLGPQAVEGVFEHHTGLLGAPDLENLLRRLAQGSLTHAEVFEHHGHGALIYQAHPLPAEGVIVTGPRRNLLAGSSLQPYFAVPFGDMMIAGCFGLLAAAADLLPEGGDTIRRSLAGQPTGAAPWDT